MTLRTALIMTAICLPNLVWAVDELSYTYVEANYQIGEVERLGSDVDFHKTGGTASYNLTENIALFGSGSVGEIETTGVGAPKDIDTRNLSAGLTAHFPLYDNVDLIVPMAIAYGRARAGKDIETDTGYAIAVGVRALLSNRLEVGATIEHVDIRDDAQSLAGSVRFHLSETISVALTGSAGNEVDTLALNGRYTF